MIISIVLLSLGSIAIVLFPAIFSKLSVTNLFQNVFRIFSYEMSQYASAIPIISMFLHFIIKLIFNYFLFI